MKQILAALLFSGLIFGTSFSATEGPGYKITSTTLFSTKIGLVGRGDALSALMVSLESKDYLYINTVLTKKDSDLTQNVLLKFTDEPKTFFKNFNPPLHPHITDPCIMVSDASLKIFMQSVLKDSNHAFTEEDTSIETSFKGLLDTIKANTTPPWLNRCDLAE